MLGMHARQEQDNVLFAGVLHSMTYDQHASAEQQLASARENGEEEENQETALATRALSRLCDDIDA
jgi:hypothetical protein